MFRFFRKKREKKIDAKKEASEERNASSFVKKNYTHTTHLLRLIHYYISLNAHNLRLLFCCYFCAIRYGVRTNLRF